MLIQLLKSLFSCITAYVDKILLSLQQNFSSQTVNFIVKLTKAKCKAIFKTACTSKKRKFIDDLLIVEQV